MALEHLLSLFVFIFGTCIGSFLNVVIYRLPKGQSVVKPRSRCSCNKRIAWYDNIPLLSWLVLRGKARCCKKPITCRYFIVEFLTGVLFVCSWFLFDDWKLVLCSMVFISILIASSFIDWDAMIIPDSLSIGGMVIGFILAILFPVLHHQESGLFIRDAIASGILSLTGICVGAGVLVWIAILGELVFKKEAMGFGDVKLMGCIGAFCGWQGCVFSIFMGATLAVFIVLPILVLKASKAKWVRKKCKDPRLTPVPFGPWLAMAAALYYFFLAPWVDGYFATIGKEFF